MSDQQALQIVAAADFRLTKALHGFIILSYRGYEGGQVNQSLSSGTSKVGAINQS